MWNVKAVNAYNLWSNFMYFIAGIYAILIASLIELPKFDRVLFIIVGIFIIINGVISCVYHVHTPSWNNNNEDPHKYKLTNEIDMAISLTSLAIGTLFFIGRLYHLGYKSKILLKDPVLYLVILFGIISLVFYLIAREKSNKANHICHKEHKDEDLKMCIKDNHEEYDIYHGNWHLFTGIFALFGITLLKNTYFI